MDALNFCYWLNGYFELNGINKESKPLSAEQIECIKEHLKLVFVKKTVTFGTLLEAKNPMQSYILNSEGIVEYLTEASC